MSMFGVFLALYTKLKTTKIYKKVLQKNQSFDEKIKQRLEEYKTTAKDNKKIINYMLAVMISAIEGVLLVITPVIATLFLFFVLIVLVVTTAIATILQGADMLVGTGDGFVAPPGSSSGYSSAAWTEAELNSRGGNLSNVDKNWYRLIMLSKQHIEKGGLKYGDNVDIGLKFAFGLVSTESGGNFYNVGGEEKNILIHTTDKDSINSAGYTGCFGLHHADILDNYFTKDKGYIAALRSQYKADKTSTDPTIDVLYAPYASAISVAHLRGKIDTARINRESTITDANALMDSFGVQNKRDELLEFLIWSLASAQYHGANQSEWKDYMAFWVALYAATSDNDAERSFDKWAIVASNHSESTARKLILGTTKIQDAHSIANPSALVLGAGDSYITLNGNKLDKPLWAYIYDKYGNKTEVQSAWKHLQKMSAGSGGYRDRVLNFHYGFNSYLQANAIITRLTANLTPLQGTNVAESMLPSTGQANEKIEKMIKHGETLIGMNYSQASRNTKYKVITAGAYSDGKNIKGTFSSNSYLDCSLFMHVLFGLNDINVEPQTKRAWNQLKNEPKIAYADLQRGDLMWFGAGGRAANISHVGMYWGDGKMIHTGNNRDKLEVEVLTNYWRGRFVGAVRLVK